jgi:hypothetical protein
MQQGLFESADIAHLRSKLPMLYTDRREAGGADGTQYGLTVTNCFDVREFPYHTSFIHTFGSIWVGALRIPCDPAHQ